MKYLREIKRYSFLVFKPLRLNVFLFGNSFSKAQLEQPSNGTERKHKEARSSVVSQPMENSHKIRFDQA